MKFNAIKIIAKYFGSLKKFTILTQLIDVQLKVFTLFFKPKVFNNMIKLTEQVKKLKDVKTINHRYGGIEFKVNGKEFGHMHGNGLVDILLNKKLAVEFCEKGICETHHVIKHTGWVSLQIDANENWRDAVVLMKKAYNLRRSTSKVVNSIVDHYDKNSNTVLHNCI